MKWESISVGPMDNNAYLLTSNDGHHALVDAADDADNLLSWINNRTIDAIITTHRHHDHIGALEQLSAATKAPCWAGKYDAETIKQATNVASKPVWTGDTIQLGNEQIRIIGLVGHTPGSITLVLPTTPIALITGDSLFPGGIGRTESTSNFTSLLSDVTHKLFDRFSDNTIVLPGHGASTTLGTERPSLSEWEQRGW